jgi:galactoside 2-L-fucosyltransferase 1/2
LNGFERVCFHVRRGDFIKKARLDQGYAIPDVAFFEKARQFYLNKFHRVQFIVVSNEKEWCMKNMFNVHVSNFSDPADDLALLSLCDHVVVTLGTFGWWGA